MMSTARTRPSLPSGLYALCDDSVGPDWSLEAKAKALVSGGVQLMQLRMKRTFGKQAIQAAKAVVALCRSAGCICLINDRVDWALLSGADGVHLGREDLPLVDARQLLGPGKIVGGTVRSLEQAREAAAEGADYVGLGPIFQTTTKSVAHPPLGLAALQHICSGSPVPVVAIAGMALGNLEDVARAGAYGAAVAQDLWTHDTPVERVKLLSLAFARGRKSSSV